MDDKKLQNVKKLVEIFNGDEEALEQFLDFLDNGYANLDETVPLIQVLIEAVKNARNEAIKGVIGPAKEAAEEATRETMGEVGEELSNQINEEISSLAKRISKALNTLSGRIKEIKIKHGKTPVRGIDYFTSEDIEAIVQLVRPVKDRDYFDGEDGEPGKRGPMPKHEWRDTELRFQNPDGSWGKWVDLRGARGFGNIFSGWGMPAHTSEVLKLRAGPGIALSGQGEITIRSTAVGDAWVRDATPSGTVNGVNLIFSLPVNASQVIVYADGFRVKGGGDTYNFTAGSDTITFISGKQPFSTISVDYLPS